MHNFQTAKSVEKEKKCYYRRKKKRLAHRLRSCLPSFHPENYSSTELYATKITGLYSRHRASFLAIIIVFSSLKFLIDIWIFSPPPKNKKEVEKRFYTSNKPQQHLMWLKLGSFSNLPASDFTGNVGATTRLARSPRDPLPGSEDVPAPPFQASAGAACSIQLLLRRTIFL